MQRLTVPWSAGLLSQSPLPCVLQKGSKEGTLDMSSVLAMKGQGTKLASLLDNSKRLNVYRDEVRQRVSCMTHRVAALRPCHEAELLQKRQELPSTLLQSVAPASCSLTYATRAVRVLSTLVHAGQEAAPAGHRGCRHGRRAQRVAGAA